MARTYAYSADFDKELENLFKDAKLLGKDIMVLYMRYQEIEL